MIPFAIMQGQLQFYSGQTLEVRVLELANNRVTLRLPHGYIKTHGEPVGVTFSFYLWEEQKYHSIGLLGFAFCKKEQTKYAEYYEIATEDFEFQNYAKLLTKEYLNYIKTRLYEDDATMSHLLTRGKYPKDEDIFSAEHTAVKQIGSTNGEKPLSVYLSLEEWRTRQAYANHTLEDFLDIYRREHVPDIGHRYQVVGVVIGNSFCPELFPTEEELAALLEKVVFEKLQLLITVPPVPESRVQEFCERLLSLRGLLWRVNCAKSTVLQLNDWGMLSWAQEFFACERGVLLCGSKRDNRRTYVNADVQEERFLDANLMWAENTVFGPLYQTNTGTFCPLAALIQNGERGRQTRMRNCPKYCTEYHLRYPAHLQLEGRGNSLFGIHPTFLSDRTRIENCVQNGAKRVVINL